MVHDLHVHFSLISKYHNVIPKLTIDIQVNEKNMKGLNHCDRDTCKSDRILPTCASYFSLISKYHKLIPKLTIDIKVNEKNMKGLNHCDR